MRARATIADPRDPRVREFVGLTDVAARSVREPAEGLFIAEGAKVIRRALAAGYRPRTVLTESKWLADIEPVLPESGVDVVVAEPQVLQSITGYRVHRGALASFTRPTLPTIPALLRDARMVVVLVDLVDHTNVGAIFRNAAALGADVVLVTPGCADPLYRRAIKVSMGTVLAIPWTRTGPDPLADLASAAGDGQPFQTIALTPARDTVDVGALASRSGGGARRALLLGTEGDGLPPDIQRRVDIRASIPMSRHTDSLNVAAASAIALHALRPTR